MRPVYVSTADGVLLAAVMPIDEPNPLRCVAISGCGGVLGARFARALGEALITAADAATQEADA